MRMWQRWGERCVGEGGESFEMGKRVMKEASGGKNSWCEKRIQTISEKVWEWTQSVQRIRRKVTTLYLLENEGFHSGKDEGNITKAAQRHGSNPAWLSTDTFDHHTLLCPSVGGAVRTSVYNWLFTLMLACQKLLVLSFLCLTTLNIWPIPALFLILFLISSYLGNVL